MTQVCAGSAVGRTPYGRWRHLLPALLVGGVLLGGGSAVWAEPAAEPASEPPPCQSVNKKSVKIEGWINREHRKNRRTIVKEFKQIKNTRTALKVFPMGTTAKVIAVGRCVPAYIAREVMAKALRYTGGIESLVQQAFLPTHWIGIGTTQFDEPSQQIVTAEQVQQLMNPDLSDAEFHALYRQFSIQDDTVPYFGLTPSNVKKVD